METPENDHSVDFTLRTVKMPVNFPFLVTNMAKDVFKEEFVVLPVNR